MAEINVEDISVYKNGTWRSLKGGKVYKSGAWHDFQGVAKGGNWYKPDAGLKSFFYIELLGGRSTTVFLTTSLNAPDRNAHPCWQLDTSERVNVEFGTLISDGYRVNQRDTVYVWQLDNVLNVVHTSVVILTAGSVIGVRDIGTIL